MRRPFPASWRPCRSSSSTGRQRRLIAPGRTYLVRRVLLRQKERCSSSERIFFAERFGQALHLRPSELRGVIPTEGTHAPDPPVAVLGRYTEALALSPPLFVHLHLPIGRSTKDDQAASLCFREAAASRLSACVQVSATAVRPKVIWLASNPAHQICWSCIGTATI